MSFITVALLEQLGACWPRERLEVAAQEWPGVEGHSDPACSWEWFLGERLRAMDTQNVLLRGDVALAQCARLRVSPDDYGALDAAARATELADRVKAIAAELRAPDAGDSNPEALIATLNELAPLLSRI